LPNQLGRKKSDCAVGGEEVGGEEERKEISNSCLRREREKRIIDFGVDFGCCFV